MDEEEIRALIERAVVEAVTKLAQAGLIQPQGLRTRLSAREIEQRRAAAIASASSRHKKSAAKQRRRANVDKLAATARSTETAAESETSERPVQRRGNGADGPVHSNISTGPDAAEGAGPSAASRCWLRYASAFKLRHGAFPPRNAKANGILAQLVGRLGAEEAPEVAEFYVKHDDPFYVKATHPVTLLLRDAEKLRTQWATGGRPTGLKPGAPWWESWPGIQEQGKLLGIDEGAYDADTSKFRRDVLQAAAAWGTLPAEAAAKLGLRRLADEG